MLENSIVLFRGTSSSELSLIFIHFLSQSPEFLVINPIKSLILLQSYSKLFFLLSLVGLSIKYLFLLISSNYPFTLLEISYT